MNNIILISTVGATVLAILYVFFIMTGVAKAPIGSKKMADAEKLISEKNWRKFSINIKDLVLVMVVLFTLLIYIFGWQIALCFLLGSVLFASIAYFNLKIIDVSNVRAAQAIKLGARQSFSLIFRSAFSSSTINIALAVLATSIVIFASNDLRLLYALAFSSAVTSIFFWSKRSIISGIITVAVVVSVGAASQYLSDFKNAQLFPLGVLSGGVLISIIVSWFLPVRQLTKSSTTIFKGLVTSGALITIGSYFLINYLLIDNGKYAVLPLFLIFTSGLVSALISIVFFAQEKILPIIIAGILILCANHFAGFYGISLALVGSVATFCLTAVFESFGEITKNAEEISLSIELSAESRSDMAMLAKDKISINNYYSLLFILSSLVLVSLFAQNLPLLGSKISDPKVFAGLLSGGALFYFLGLKQLSRKIYQIAFAVLSIVASTLLLGSTFLAGLLVGAIVTNALLGEKENYQVVLLLALTSLLTSFIIVDSYTLYVRLIISGAVLVAGLLFIVWRNYSEPIIRIFSNKAKNEPQF